MLDKEVSPKNGLGNLRQGERVHRTKGAEVEVQLECSISINGGSIRFTESTRRTRRSHSLGGWIDGHVGASVDEKWALQPAAEKRKGSCREWHCVDGGEIAGGERCYCPPARPFPGRRGGRASCLSYDKSLDQRT